jgi:hypothetical protein
VEFGFADLDVVIKTEMASGVRQERRQDDRHVCKPVVSWDGGIRCMMALGWLE